MEAAGAGPRRSNLQIPVFAGREVDHAGGAQVLGDGGAGVEDAPGTDVLKQGADVDTWTEAALQPDVGGGELVLVVLRVELLVVVSPAGDERGFAPRRADAEVEPRGDLRGVK